MFFPNVRNKATSHVWNKKGFIKKKDYDYSIDGRVIERRDPHTHQLFMYTQMFE
jgi:hypothetical protein